MCVRSESQFAVDAQVDTFTYSSSGTIPRNSGISQVSEKRGQTISAARVLTAAVVGTVCGEEAAAFGLAGHSRPTKRYGSSGGSFVHRSCNTYPRTSRLLRRRCGSTCQLLALDRPTNQRRLSSTCVVTFSRTRAFVAAVRNGRQPVFPVVSLSLSLKDAFECQLEEISSCPTGCDSTFRVEFYVTCAIDFSVYDANGISRSSGCVRACVSQRNHAE